MIKMRRIISLIKLSTIIKEKHFIMRQRMKKPSNVTGRHSPSTLKPEKSLYYNNLISVLSSSEHKFEAIKFLKPILKDNPACKAEEACNS